MTPPHPNAPVGRLWAAALRERPFLHGLLYLGTAATIYQTVGGWFTQDAPDTALRFHLTLLPATALVTAAFAQIRPDPAIAGEAGGLRRVAVGAGLGGGAWLAKLAVLLGLGWAALPAWGWAQHSGTAVAGGVAFQVVAHLAVSLNEEIVYRGYAYGTLAAAGRPGLAALALTALFALNHQLTPQTLLGQFALGAALMALRHTTGSVWAPVGYHWAWNVIQSAILGPTDGLPTIRYLTVDGPASWVGRPGHPEPGLLSTLTNLLVAAAVLWWARRKTG